MKSSINRSSVSCWHQNNNSYKTFFYWRSHNDALLLGIKQRKIRFTPVAPWSHRLTHLHKTLSQKKKRNSNVSLPKRIDHSLSPTLSHSQAVRWAQGMCWVMDWADQSRAELVMCERRREYQTLGEFSGLMCDRWAAAGLLWRTYERDAASHEGLEESVGVREEEERRHGEDGSFVMFLSLSLKWKKNNNNKTKHWFVRVCVCGGFITFIEALEGLHGVLQACLLLNVTVLFIWIKV